MPVKEWCSPVSIAFSDASLNANERLWDFGDGVTSNLQNPAHGYSASGTSIVRLIRVR